MNETIIKTFKKHLGSHHHEMVLAQSKNSGLYRVNRVIFDNLKDAEEYFTTYTTDHCLPA